MKPIVLLFPAVLFVFFSSCHTPAEKDKGTYSYELGPMADTINMTVNGLKQGIWIKTTKGKKDTAYYRNDTLISIR